MKKKRPLLIIILCLVLLALIASNVVTLCLLRAKTTEAEQWKVTVSAYNVPQSDASPGATVLPVVPK